MLGNRLLKFLSNMLTNLNLTDMETGYKAFTRDVAQRLVIRENRFGFEPEFTARVAKMRVRIFEVGVSYTGRSYTEGKKITWKDGVSALRCILRYNLFPLTFTGHRHVTRWSRFRLIGQNYRPTRSHYIQTPFTKQTPTR